MAYTDNDWEIVKSYYERGYSLAEIVKQSDVSVTDRSSISKRAKVEGWIKGEKSTLVEKELQVKQDIEMIKREKSTLNSTELLIHNKIVNERASHIDFFNNAAITNVKEAMRAPCESQLDYKARAETINKGREVVLGKTPDTAIQINNDTAKASNKITFEVIDVNQTN